MFRSKSVETLPRFQTYLGAVGERFCPFIGPAQEEGVLFFSEYALSVDDPQILHETVFYLGVLHTELLRKERRRQKTRSAHDLMCENILFHPPPNVEINGSELFAWPHGLLKLLYTKAGVMFGKFWKGELDKARDGRDIPVPPDHFLSIRSAIKPTDSRFFSKAPRLTEAYLQSMDKGERVLSEVFGNPVSPVISRVELLEPELATRQLFLDLLAEMRRTDFYGRLRAWGEIMWRG